MPQLCPKMPGAQTAMTAEKPRISAADAVRNFNATLRRLALRTGQRAELRDEDVGGLVLRIDASGGATWCLRTRTHDGKQTRPTIGSYPGLGLADARKAARAMLVRIQSGGDVVQEKRDARAAREAQAAERTVAGAFGEWIESREMDKAKPLSAVTVQQYRSVFVRDVLPKLGKRPVRDVTRDDWVGVIAARRRATPAAASLLYRTVSSFLSFAEASGWIAGHPLPRKGLATLAPQPKPRARRPEDFEIADLMAVSDKLSDKLRCFVRLLVLTGARRTQVANLNIRDIDLEDATWRVPAEAGSKNYIERVVPLSPLALEAIRRVWPAEPGGDDFRMLGAVANSGLQGFSKAKAQVDRLLAEHRADAAQQAGVKPQPVKPWVWHDLRRAARSGMAGLGIPGDVAELAIGHISGRTKLERTYDRHDYAEETKAALLRWQAHVAALVSPSEGAAVVALRRAV